MYDTNDLRGEERVALSLRSLYRAYGYLPFKMSKFEEYDYYVKNKEFLVGDGVITFNDTNGRLLALKPDVTLSIIKSTRYEKGVKQKLFYDENVYRVSQFTHRYKEIMQTGLECIGDLDGYDIYEAVLLALESLDRISPRFMLDISHMGILSALLDEALTDTDFQREAIRLLGEKNSHELKQLCAEKGIKEASADKLLSLLSLYGVPDAVLPRLSALCESDAARKSYESLVSLVSLLSDTPYIDRIRIDFSVVNNMSYYNGIVMKGFLEGISEGVLSGGEYGALLGRMSRQGNAVGFALYLDIIADALYESREYDVDVLLIAENAADEEIRDAASALRAEGKSVSVQRACPTRLRARETVVLKGE